MIGFQSNVVAGTVLVRSAIQSPNYVAGVSGWTINQDGSVEFNNATIRGTLIAGGGAVTVSSTGIVVQGLTTKIVINTVAGFIITNVPDNGSQTQFTPGAVFLTPAIPSPVGVAGVGFASYFVGYLNSGAVNEAPFTQYSAVGYTGKAAPDMTMVGQSNDSATDNSKLQFSASQLYLNGNAVGMGWIDGDGLTANKGPYGATETIVLTTFQQTFKANHAYEVRMTGLVSVSVSGSKPNIRVRQSSDGTVNLGTQITNVARSLNSTGQEYIGFTAKFIVGSADVTTYIVMTLMGSGAFTVTALASPPFMFDVYDMGSAANNSHAVTIV